MTGTYSSFPLFEHRKVVLLEKYIRSRLVGSFMPISRTHAVQVQGTTPSLRRVSSTAKLSSSPEEAPVGSHFQSLYEMSATQLAPEPL